MKLSSHWVVVRLEVGVEADTIWLERQWQGIVGERTPSEFPLDRNRT